MIKVENISRSFHQRMVLDDVSFSLEEGKIIGLLGPNGAGKTTLMRTINQIIEPSKGSITYNDRLFRRQDLINIGYLPEERGLYPTMTVEKQLLFLGQLRGLTKAEVKKQLNFWLDRFNIQDWRKKRIEELSKGMAQKVQFICTVLHEPSILILDEPFSGFDPINIELIRKEILRLKEKGCAILISTHNMKNVEEMCDKVVLINKGSIVLEGTTQAIREAHKNGVYKITFQGNMIAFTNALWIGYEIVDKEVVQDDVFRVYLKMRKGNTLDNLLQTVMGQVKIQAVEEVLPGMEEVFIQAIQSKNQSNNE